MSTLLLREDAWELGLEFPGFIELGDSDLLDSNISFILLFFNESAPLSNDIPPNGKPKNLPSQPANKFDIFILKNLPAKGKCS